MGTKNKLLLAASFILVFMAGLAAMRMWDVSRARLAENADVPLLATDSLLSLDLEEASAPEGVTEVEKPDYVESDVPSQLSKINVPGMEKIISRSAAQNVPEEEEKTEAVLDLTNVSAPADSAPEDAPKSSISMINAPVSARLITNAEEYKAFKRVARGSYPAANFAKENVLVLESSSNLPDKVFEIQSVKEEDGKMVVRYRVSVFGLDKKTNTHSAQLIQKSNLSLELKQVL